MEKYRISLDDVFAGPLDLLLYLVRKEEVDIYDIPIANVTKQYMQHVELLNQLDIELAGDFLVMAATLMEIKSAMLLPKVNPEDEMSEEGSDPRAELIRQLLEYKKFKDAARLLDTKQQQQEERFARPNNMVKKLKPDVEVELDMDQVSIWNLLDAFDSIMRATGRVNEYSHIKDDTPIDKYQVQILSRLQNEGPMTFNRIFDGFGKNKLAMVGLFLATLELIRNKLMWAEQTDSEKTIYLRSLTDEPAETAVPNAIMATEEERMERMQQESNVDVSEEDIENDLVGQSETDTDQAPDSFEENEFPDDILEDDLQQGDSEDDEDDLIS